MKRFHGIPVTDASIYPQWMHDQKPVEVRTLRTGQTFVGFAGDGNCQRWVRGPEHTLTSVYHTTHAETGTANCIGASALVWPEEKGI